MTLTDEEKREALAGDHRVRELLLRQRKGSRRSSSRSSTGGCGPRRNGSRLAVRTASGPGTAYGSVPAPPATCSTWPSAARARRLSRFQQDYEDRVHVAVTIDDDPGRDLGQSGMPGHRFFYAVDELEPLDEGGVES